MAAADPSEARAALVRAATAWADLSPEQGEQLAEAFSMRTLDARETLARPGDAAHDIVFVASGLLRFYYPGADGREANKAFVAEGAFAGAIAAATLGLPLLYGIEALEASVVLTVPYPRWAALLDAEPAFERLGRRLAERILTRKELRTRSLLLQNATERYLDFCRAHPDLVQRVPQHHIASLLGMSAVHLSRVRREMAEGSGGDGAADAVLNPG